MSAAVPTWPVSRFDRLPIPAAVFEIVAYLAVVAAASLAFAAGWLSINAAVVLTVVLLASLIVLSWIHLGQGRHPVFLFLCTLMLFQGGKLMAYCVGAEPDPLQIMSMTPAPFYVPLASQATTLLILALSAVCIYAPCRWMYRPIARPDLQPYRRYLPYLYLVLLIALPVMLYKNYSLYQLAQRYGGYTFLFSNQRDLAEKVPLLVRAASAIGFPVFVAVYTFEDRKLRLVLTTVLYMAATIAVLLLGSRGAFFQMIATLWYITRVKSNKRPSGSLLFVGLLCLALLATGIRAMREDPDNPGISWKDTAAFTDAVALQGYSIDVTQLSVQYAKQLRANVPSYLWHELLGSYTTYDASHYSRGMLYDFDVSVLLNPYAFSVGLGTGGSYVGEAYLMGGVLGVLIISVLVGMGLSGIYVLNRNAGALFLGGMLVFSVIWLPRGDLLSPLSAFSRNLLVVGLLAVGWKLYTLIFPIRHIPSTGASRAQPTPVR